jgi:hypothetical protein
VGGTAKRERGLGKRVASAMTTGGPHPRAVRLGSRLHLWMLRRFGGTGFLARDVLVLTTTGRRSGQPRSTPLYYVHRGDGADRKYGLRLQEIIGSAKWPWQRTTEQDVTDAINILRQYRPQLVAVSPHDSSAWTLARFATAFADDYHRIRVGDEIRISADSPA